MYFTFYIVQGITRIGKCEAGFWRKIPGDGSGWAFLRPCCGPRYTNPDKKGT